MAKAAEEEIEERVVPARREPQAGRVTVPDQLREPCIVEVAAQITCGDGAVPENGRENSGGNEQKTPDVLAHERDGLREDGCGRLGLGTLSTITSSARLDGFARLCCVKKSASASAKVCAASLQTYHETS